MVLRILILKCSEIKRTVVSMNLIQTENPGSFFNFVSDNYFPADVNTRREKVLAQSNHSSDNVFQEPESSEHTFGYTLSTYHLSLKTL